MNIGFSSWTAAGVALLLSLGNIAPAYADGPPAGGTEHLTPPEPTALPTASAVPSAESEKLVEVLHDEHPSRLAAYIFGGVAIVGVGVGTAFGILALNNQSNYNASPNASSQSSANQDAVIADVAIGAAVIAGVTSVVLFLKHEEPSAKSTVPASSVSFSIAPIVDPHEAGAGVLLRF